MDLFFGHPLKLNYAGSESYGTCCGAVASLTIVTCILAFFTLQVKLVIFRYYQLGSSLTGLQDSSISTVTTYDAALLAEGYELGVEDSSTISPFSVTIGLKQVEEFDYSFLGSNPSDFLIDPRFGTLEAKLVEYVTDPEVEERTQTRTEASMPIGDCSNELP